MCVCRKSLFLSHDIRCRTTKRSGIEPATRALARITNSTHTRGMCFLCVAGECVANILLWPTTVRWAKISIIIGPGVQLRWSNTVQIHSCRYLRRQSDLTSTFPRLTIVRIACTSQKKRCHLPTGDIYLRANIYTSTELLNCKNA